LPLHADSDGRQSEHSRTIRSGQSGGEGDNDSISGKQCKATLLIPHDARGRVARRPRGCCRQFGAKDAWTGPMYPGASGGRRRCRNVRASRLVTVTGLPSFRRFRGSQVTSEPGWPAQVTHGVRGPVAHDFFSRRNVTGEPGTGSTINAFPRLRTLVLVREGYGIPTFSHYFSKEIKWR
jgi:hypothetical protein